MFRNARRDADAFRIGGRQAEGPKVRRSGRCWPAGLLLVLLPAAAAQSYVPPLDPPPPQSHAQPEPWVRLHAVLAEVTGEEFRSRALELCASYDFDAIDAVILRAGTAVPPGVPQAVQERRAATRREALELVAQQVQDSEPETRTVWRGRLVELLEREGGDARWRAAARAAAELSLYELAPSLARGLDPQRPRSDRSVARSGLYRLHRRWFESPEDFAAFWPRVQGRGVDEVDHDALERAQQEALRLRERLLELDPEREGLGLLAHADPSLRARAARSLRRGIGEGRVSAEACIDALVSALLEEGDAQAAYAMLDALLSLLASSPSDSPRVFRLRDALATIAERAEPELEWPVLEALTRLPWSQAASDDPGSLGAGVARVAQLFRRMVLEREVLDSDVLIQVLASWRNLCARAAGAAGAGAGITLNGHLLPAREAIRFVLQQAEVTTGARRAAASSIATVLPASPSAAVGQVVELLEQRPGDALVEFELLRSVSDRLARLDSTGELARRLERSLIARLSSPSPDLRLAALSSLAGTADGALLDVELAQTLLERLEAEPEPELRMRLLEILSTTQRPELVDHILLAHGFDDLVRGDARRVTAVAAALGRLAGDDGLRTMRSASRLVGVRHDETHLVRLELALGLVAALPAEIARNLAPAEHREVLRWALELRERGALRSPEGGDPTQLPRRLVEVHMRGAREGIDGDSRALSHAAAVFAGDLSLARSAGADVEQVLALYEEALAFAIARGAAGSASGASQDAGDSLPPPRPALVQRDRARFLLAAGRQREALADYRVLLAGAPEDLRRIAQAASGPEGLLQLSDLRSAASLVGNAELAQRAPREAAAEACELSLALVRNSAWPKLAPASRVQDLRDLAERALASGREDQLASARSIFAELPEVPAAPVAGGGGTNGSAVGGAEPAVPAAGGAGDPAAPLPLWQGLLREPSWHRALADARAKLFGTATAPGGAPGEAPGARQPALQQKSGAASPASSSGRSAPGRTR